MKALQYDESYSPIDTLSNASFHAERTVLSYTFSHEYPTRFNSSNAFSRMQQAFYTLIPEDQLPSVHLRLSRVFTKLVLQPGLGSSQAIDSQDDASIFVPLPAQFSANTSVNLQPCESMSRSNNVGRRAYSIRHSQHCLRRKSPNLSIL